MRPPTPEKIMNVFQHLDALTKPVGIHLMGTQLSSNYTRIVENFLRKVKLEMMANKYSWSQMFNIRMRNARKVVTKERYNLCSCITFVVLLL
jgi:hypothetical protein